MLKNVPSIISPELLKILMEMGHGDEIVIGDGNFPGANLAKRLIRLDGHGVDEVLSAILKLFPLDTYSDNVVLMQKMECDKDLDIKIWKDYDRICASGDAGYKGLSYIDRFKFYDRTRDAFAVIMTGETEIYANILLKKGVVKQ
ncbi:MAG: RbsD/FucU domain-containing protein [Sphaerochaetaceae bacterium]|jgi:L-fucose mutarotase|nr:RbsD/FucU domain-containing protein [Sphaerochaetaceae bacterium]MDD3163966.1 RbsD/FucU domain-containing protein [Sphaerochaetaceae bacterium]MDD4007879.1 RbsD/FucU domain-containing protein [Sphaerochaetaceae bacterium]MDD4397233.1 RbsD/FucU domain-containing protein [Sphaerochaetaceae bacterium]